MLWLKRKLAQDEEQDRENKSKRESKRAANGYIVFLKQEYTKLVKENPEKTERNQCHAGREVEVHQWRRKTEMQGTWKNRVPAENQ